MAEDGDARGEDRGEPGEASERGESGSGGRSRRELAKERTDWSHERTLLAKQRTFAAWLRTGLSAVAVGFAAAQLLGDLDPQWLVQTASILVVLAGGTIFVIGFTGYRNTFRKLQQEGVEGVPPWIIGAVTLAMLLAAGLVLLAMLTE